MSLPKTTRRLHRWGSIVIALPALVIFVTGMLLQLKKQWPWIQPPTQRSETALDAGPAPSADWSAILAAVAAVPEAEVAGWSDVDRLDVRPARGIVKVRCSNRWEVQLDLADANVLSSTYRRSDLIESIHDGSWFHPLAKTWVWLPAGAVLLVLWGTGLYLWWLPHAVRRRRR